MNLESIRGSRMLNILLIILTLNGIFPASGMTGIEITTPVLQMDLSPDSPVIKFYSREYDNSSENYFKLALERLSEVGSRTQGGNGSSSHQAVLATLQWSLRDIGFGENHSLTFGLFANASDFDIEINFYIFQNAMDSSNGGGGIEINTTEVKLEVKIFRWQFENSGNSLKLDMSLFANKYKNHGGEGRSQSISGEKGHTAYIRGPETILADNVGAMYEEEITSSAKKLGVNLIFPSFDNSIIYAPVVGMIFEPTDDGDVDSDKGIPFYGVLILLPIVILAMTKRMRIRQEKSSSRALDVRDKGKGNL